MHEIILFIQFPKQTGFKPRGLNAPLTINFQANSRSLSGNLELEGWYARSPNDGRLHHADLRDDKLHYDEAPVIIILSSYKAQLSN